MTRTETIITIRSQLLLRACGDRTRMPAIYYLARMLYAGEEPAFIARRIMICASEDVGNADPQALQVAVAASQAVERLGMPEARITLAQAAAYVACAPKSNAAIMAIDEAMALVRSTQAAPVPPYLQDAHYGGQRSLDMALAISMPTTIRIIMSDSSTFRMLLRIRSSITWEIWAMRKR